MRSTRYKLILFLLIASVLTALSAKFILDCYDFSEPPGPPNYSLIEPGLYMGGQCTRPPANVQSVLNLSLHKDNFSTDFYVWHPIPDGAPAPDISWLRDQVEFIDTQRSAGREVFIHCDAGISRSGMVMAAYLMNHYSWSRDQALDFIRTKRPIVHPNAAFMDLLNEWEDFVKTSTSTSHPSALPFLSE